MKPRILLPFLSLFFIIPNLSTAQWTNLGSGITTPSRTIAGIFPVNEEVIWGFTWHPTNFIITSHDFTRTIDGGQTWLPGTLNGVASEQLPFYLFPLDDQTAWLATADAQNPIAGHVYKTNDGGNTWVQQTTGFTGFNETPTGIYFWNENEGFAYGATCNDNYNDQIAIFTTDNGGENWTKVVAPEMPAQQPGEGICIWNFASFFSVVGDTVWFGTTMARIFKSVDRGHTWESFSTPFPNSRNITSVSFKDSQTGIALSFQPFGIARTTDGGANWNILPGTYPSNYWGAQVEYIPGTRSTWLIVASPDKYLLSYDDGEHWETFDSNIEPWSVEFLDASTGFAGSYHTNAVTASIFKWTAAPLGNRFFVNDDATGANNGLSWEDAFNDLQDALVIAENGDQIWVAEGNYLPGDNPEATFMIDANLHLYGGFIGTETSLEERDDPADHPTILSGDLNGDDVEGDLFSFRSDNVRTVMTINESITNETLIDGFTIQNGHAFGTEENQERQGGAIYCEGSPIIRSCRFRQNYAFSLGGAVFMTDTLAQGTTMENCHFEANQTSLNAQSQGGAIAVLNVPNEGIRILQSSFDGNESGWAGGIYLFNSNGLLDGVSFTNNSSPRQGGAVRFFANDTYHNASLSILDCSFEQNTASFGGGVYALLFGSNPELTFRNTSFRSNTVVSTLDGWGAGGGGFCVFTEGQNTTIMIDSCSFDLNSAQYNPSAFQVQTGASLTLNLTNSNFTENETQNFYGIAAIWTNVGGSGQVAVENCIFENNTSEYVAGLDIGNLRWAGPTHFEVRDCRFINNQAVESGGALSIWGDFGSSPSFVIEDCIMESNTANQHAGAIWINTSSTNFDAVVSHCKIIDNQTFAGGAIEAYKLDVLPAFPADAVFSLQNSLIAGNTSNPAAVTLDNFPGFQMQNVTIANNESNGMFLQDNSHLVFQNSILSNPGFIEFENPTMDAVITSNGGNLVLDSSLNSLLTPQDKPETEPDFMPDTYEPTSGSPLVNGGVNDGVTALFDIVGNDRIQHDVVDIGAYESPFPGPVATREVIAGKIGLSPNPAADILNFKLPDSVSFPVEVSLFDVQGRLVDTQVIINDQAMKVSHLSSGSYTLKMRDDRQLYIGKFVKQ